MSLTTEFDERLGPRGRSLIGQARSFAQEVVAPTLRCSGGWAGDTIRAASKMGLAGIEIPQDFGGSGLPFSVRARVAEELAQVDFPFSFALINHHNAAARIAESGSTAAKDYYLPPMLAGEIIGCTGMSEDGVGSDFAAIAADARRKEGGWLLEGSKRWIGNAAGADVLLTFAQTDLDKRGRDGIACFIVDGRREGFTRNPVEPLAALTAAGVGGYALHDYFVPSDHVLYQPGEGFSLGMAGINKARTHIAAMACGMIAASLDAALLYVRNREAFGRSLIDNQGLRWSLADVATVLEALRLLSYRSARLIDTEPEAATKAAAMAKKFTADNAMPALAACVQAMGARGLSDDAIMGRHLMACPALGIADGTTQMMNERIGAIITKASREKLNRSNIGGRGDVMFEAIVLERDTEAKTHASISPLSREQLPVGDVTVKIDFSTLNYKDALAITGRGPVVRQFPMVPGIDFAGVVEDSSDPRYKPGDLVLLNGWGVGETHWGGLSQRARVKGDWLVPLPLGMTARQAMSIGTAGYTAMLCASALEEHGITPDSGAVLVTGANGGVGTIAIALLARRGYRVIASTGRVNESSHLINLGAAEIIDRTELAHVGKPLQKERWVAAVDCVGSQTLVNVCAGLKYGGVVAACGLAQGMDFPATVAPFILRGITLVGIDSVYVPRPKRIDAWTKLAKEIPQSMLSDNTTEVHLPDVISVANQLLIGQVRGRVIVNVN